MPHTEDRIDAARVYRQPRPAISYRASNFGRAQMLVERKVEQYERRPGQISYGEQPIRYRHGKAQF